MTSSIQLLRSSIAKERPFPGNLLEGQPAININPTEPGFFFKTTDGTIVKLGPAAITSDGLPPNSNGVGLEGNTIGELWLDKSLDPPVLKVFDGTIWVNAGSGGGEIPENLVTSVNGKIGDVVLSAEDVGAYPEADTYTKNEVNSLITSEIVSNTADGSESLINTDAILSKKEAASFLRKTTLGPTLTEIDQLVEIGSKRQWLIDQISSSFDNSNFSEWDDSQETLIHKPGWFGSVGLSLRLPIGLGGGSTAWWRPGRELVSRALLTAFIRNNPTVGGVGDLSPQATYKAPRKSLLCKITWVLNKFIPVSTPGAGFDETPGWSIVDWYSLLARYAFRNYADLLEAISYNTAMAAMLTHIRNEKESPDGRQPDENYAREIIQLFTIGLYSLEIDGSPKLDEDGNLIENYTNDDVFQMARVFTGLTRSDLPRDFYYSTDPAIEELMRAGGTTNVLIDGKAFQENRVIFGIKKPAQYIEKSKIYRIFSLGNTDFSEFGVTNPGIGTTFVAQASGNLNSGTGEVEEQLVYPPGIIPRLKHYYPWYETGAKVLPNVGISIPANTDPETNIKLAIQGLINHPSCAPFVCKSLIKLAVTSNPSPGYVARVAKVFRDNGRGVTGDMISVWIAIFSDPEAGYSANSSLTNGRVRDGFEGYCNILRSFDGSSYIGSSQTTQIHGFADVNNDLYSSYDLYWEGEYQNTVFPGLIEQREEGTGQAVYGAWPFQSFSIFGYYPLDYSITPALDWGILLPEMASLPSNRLMSAHNSFSTGFRDPVYYRNNIETLNYIPINNVIFRSYSDILGDLLDSSDIVNKLDLVLCGGTLSIQQKAEVKKYLDSQPVSNQNQRDNRVTAAYRLILASPEFWIN